MIGNIKVGLLLAVCRDLPLRHFIQIGEIGICCIGMIDFFVNVLTSQ